MRGWREESVGRTDPVRRNFLKASGAALAIPFLARPASAQAWPARPVRVIIPYPPGGGADTVGRIYFAKLSEVLGQQFVIDNRGGAGGTIAEAVPPRPIRTATLFFMMPPRSR